MIKYHSHHLSGILESDESEMILLLLFLLFFALEMEGWGWGEGGALTTVIWSQYSS